MKLAKNYGRQLMTYKLVEYIGGIAFYGDGLLLIALPRLKSRVYYIIAQIMALGKSATGKNCHRRAD